MGTPDTRHSWSGHTWRRRRAAAVWLAALAVPAVLAAGDAGSNAGRADLAPRLEAISSEAQGRALSVLLQLSEPVAYVTSQPDPLTVLVDLRNVSAAGTANRFAAAPNQPVSAVTLEERAATDGAAVARVRVHLAAAVPFKVRSSRNVIRVDVEGRAVAPLAPGPARRPSDGPRPAARATVLSGLRVANGPEGTTLILSGDGRVPMPSPWLADNPPRLVLDFPGLTPEVARETAVGVGGVDRVRVALNRTQPPMTRLVVDMAESLRYDLRPEGDDLRVVLRTGAASTPPLPVPPPAALAEDLPSVRLAEEPPPVRLAEEPPLRIPIPEEVLVQEKPAPASRAMPPPPPDVTQAAAPASAPKPAAPQATSAPQAPVPPPQAPTQAPTGALAAGQTGRGSEQKYTGQPISLDFAGVDLRSVLRMFADISGLNIVIDPKVSGTVDLALRDIPWDQALEIILRSNQLGYTVEGTVVRIAPLTVLADEEAQRRKLADEQALGGELEILTRTLSYAKAEEMRALLEKGALTKRGQAQVDPRTNTIIIRDLPSGLEAAALLMDTLDKPQPQVEIEARILQTNRSFARKLGAQLGFLGRATPDLGNTLPLAFPNQGSVSGRTGAAQGASGGAVVPSGVNLPVQGATSAIGLTLGAVNGAFNIDAVLTAAEESGQGRILSNPRVFAQNNVAAEITQGVQIPIQTIANNTVTVTFKDAALSLNVTPQISANDTVVLQIRLENASPDYTRVINNIPPIDTQRAVTQILVRDGQTAVLGGVHVSQEQAKTERTPGLGKIPILGWLFRREDLSDGNRELLIFITPRIVKS